MTPAARHCFSRVSAIDFREHDVEDNDVVRGGAALDVAFLAIGGDINSEAFLFQPLSDSPNNGRTILDQQYAHVTLPTLRTRLTLRLPLRG